MVGLQELIAWVIEQQVAVGSVAAGVAEVAVV